MLLVGVLGWKETRDEDSKQPQSRQRVEQTETHGGLGFEGKRDFTASWTNGRDFEVQLES